MNWALPSNKINNNWLSVKDYIRKSNGKNNIMSIKNITAIFCLLTFSYSVNAEILLFSNDNEFKGCLDCSRLDRKSVCNRYGDFGSRYSDNSIWSRYGLGSRYNGDSPFARYGQGLKMVDNAGNFYGYFSISSGGEKNMRKLLENLWESTNGDYSMMRDQFCD